jgi:hypothetical protein
MDSATYLPSEGDGGVMSLLVAGSVPVARATTFNVVLPVGSPFILGNPTLGASHVGQVSESFWITGGGSIGVPLMDEELESVGADLTIPRARWGWHHYIPAQVPLQAHLLFEVHASIVEMRAHLEPTVWIGIGNKDGDSSGGFYHAFEVQLGHTVGGGLRIQGVATATDDAYQFAMSPFFVVQQELGFVRTALMLPIDNDLGPAFDDSDRESLGAWGFLLSLGIHLD